MKTSNDGKKEQQQVDNVLANQGKVYEERKVYIATFIGGPLVGGYMIANNFKCFGDLKRVRQTWIFTAVIVLFLLIGGFLLAKSKVPRLSIPFVYSFLAYVIAKYYQEKQINRHLDQGGGWYGWGRTILVALIGLAITMLLSFGILLALDPIFWVTGSSVP